MTAVWGRQLIDYVRSITLRPSVGLRVQTGSGGTTLTLDSARSSAGGSAFPWQLMAFGYAIAFDSSTSVTTCTINAGTLRIHGIAAIAFAATTLELLAETCTVYAEKQRGNWGTGGSILVSASPSASSNSHYRFPLYTFAYDGTTGRHTLETIHHIGDIQLDTPVM